jgi:CRISPR/Cas system-associated protein endoribonuclease Cas2
MTNRVMRVLVMFDLPVTSCKDRRSIQNSGSFLLMMGMT